MSFVIMITHFTSFVKALEENFFSPPKSLDFFISLRYNSGRVYPSEDTYMVAVAPFPNFGAKGDTSFAPFATLYERSGAYALSTYAPSLSL